MRFVDCTYAMGQNNEGRDGVREGSETREGRSDRSTTNRCISFSADHVVVLVFGLQHLSNILQIVPVG